MVNPGKNNEDIDAFVTREKVDYIRKELLKWWITEKREFPWRNTFDPYQILVAEILLHRTRAEQVVNLYIHFINLYPSLDTLKQIQADKIKLQFHSAGLHWRWDLMYEMIQQIYDRFEGVIPSNMNDLLSLPGISRYIAAAIRCFAYNYPEVILDTNTVRVTGRIYGMNVNDSSRRSSKFRRILEKTLDIENSRNFNFALLDLAAKICTARNPNCIECPIQKTCEYWKET